nr:SDR family oxidoreductase [Chlorobium sp. N1]
MHCTLITGASMGIGEAFAREFARRGNNLILVARSAERLHTLAEELREKRRVEVLVCTADLTRSSAPDEVHQFCRRNRLKVELLINAAGLSFAGGFSTIPREKLEELMAVNMLALARLTRLFSADMTSEGSGGIINIASLAGLQGLPGLGLYSATKSFVITLTEALHEELRPSGVKVVAVCPGFIETGFFSVAGHDPSSILLPISDPSVVVRAAVRGLMKNRMRVYPTLIDSLLAFAERLAPREISVRLAAFLSGVWGK